MPPTSQTPLGNSTADAKRRQGSGTSVSGKQDPTWIVSIVPEVNARTVARSLVESVGGRLRFVYRHVHNGFAFDGPVEAATEIHTNASVADVRRARSRKPRSSQTSEELHSSEVSLFLDPSNP